MEKFAVILAAGKGTRMKSRREDISKVSFQILGQPIVQYVINALKPIGFFENRYGCRFRWPNHQENRRERD
jgi:NDP-sugar pyrophosphorylase family protein